VFVAVIGPRWMDLLRQRQVDDEYDYVRTEIATALRRGINVIPVMVGREGNMPRLPRPEELPEDIREFVQYQKHDVVHERFRRDIGDLIQAVESLMRPNLMAGQAPSDPIRTRWPAAVTWRWIGIIASVVWLLVGFIIGNYIESENEIRVYTITLAECRKRFADKKDKNSPPSPFDQFDTTPCVDNARKAASELHGDDAQWKRGVLYAIVPIPFGWLVVWIVLANRNAPATSRVDRPYDNGPRRRDREQGDV
jgi:hypothetical protein